MAIRRIDSSSKKGKGGGSYGQSVGEVKLNLDLSQDAGAEVQEEQKGKRKKAPPKIKKGIALEQAEANRAARKKALKKKPAAGAKKKSSILKKTVPKAKKPVRKKKALPVKKTALALKEKELPEPPETLKDSAISDVMADLDFLSTEVKVVKEIREMPSEKQERVKRTKASTQTSLDGVMIEHPLISEMNVYIDPLLSALDSNPPYVVGGAIGERDSDLYEEIVRDTFEIFSEYAPIRAVKIPKASIWETLFADYINVICNTLTEESTDSLSVEASLNFVVKMKGQDLVVYLRDEAVVFGSTPYFVFFLRDSKEGRIEYVVLVNVRSVVCR